jgi:hypothetical protein
MKEYSPIQQSFLHAAGVFFYTMLVASILTNGEKLFGQMRNIYGPVAFLMLFVISATIVGLLVLAKPAMLYASGAKGEGVKFLGYTVGWLCAITVVMFLVQIFSA